MKWLAPCLALLSSAALAGPLPEANATFPEPDMARVELGHLLFYDPILSGNKTVSCATCHHPRLGTGDGLSLGFGDGATGLGIDRVIDPDNPPELRIPRNAPTLFNLGAAEFTRFFHDGRLEEDPTRPSGIRTPLGAEMESGFDSALAAQAMFPVLSGDEMAGHYSENDVAQAVRQGFLTGPGGAWDILAKRIEAIPDYRARFDVVLGPDTPIHFFDIANVIADFIIFEWRGDNSPFDRFLRNGRPLPPDAAAGMALFYGKAQCDSCHAGQFQTDHGYHAIAMPQIGPGKAARFERHNRDTGRARVTGDDADLYRFRTPSLRNLPDSGPYGHSGAYATIEGVVRHHLDPVESLWAYEPDQALLLPPGFDSDFAIMSDPEEINAIAAANELAPMTLSDTEVDQIVAFLRFALNDPGALNARLGVPSEVPSGLLVDQ
ncbi:cytochrome-c peroxidase [Shimia aestuarii]|uniref:Cytochrome c peroxidase n=1 Tax=Shimia aestuarii TaxID=254406 RepID=A0A1I4RZS2_9RHOB|nr:cytochrome c peroxidase [Shimia aestuarii]SFM57484.1 cytochrome c peroxidase [Shimia aestuarii]